MEKIVVKVTSKTDTNRANTNQAGIYVLREHTKFFPKLNEKEKNPRKRLAFKDKSTGFEYSFNYIHYNNKKFGGTRDEYRLTGFNEYIQNKGINPGEYIIFERKGFLGLNKYFVDFA